MKPAAQSIEARLKAALTAGVMAGLVDIVAASMINHAPPARILQSIASGVLGMAAYSGGGGAIALGLLLQILMSIVIASVYALPTQRLPWLVSRPLAAGLAFGVGVFVVMNLVVVPLSAFAPKPKHVTLAFLSLNLAAMLVFGVLVATLARWSLRRAGDADLVGG